ncbi:hypothetical protein [Yersinia hibernica]|uniref:Uncharacterized protein n=1 Tax=Yersinia enterocolitica LC20 TaxID=1443113 RepID=A0A7U4GEI0_YEREN|nr:hypothetical protein [Yersinia hibernica]AHM73230.1 hypothetical protein LC20_01977 [Yersinia hibernica]OVZ85372.1 hypothetical protein CBW54_12840 [Yersinia kristensenii]
MLFIKWFLSKMMSFINKNVKLRLCIIKVVKKFGLYNKLKPLSKKVNNFLSTPQKEQKKFLHSDESTLSPHTKRMYALLNKKLKSNKGIS